MKKHLLISAVLFFVTGFIASAQIQYIPTYNRTYESQSTYQNSEPNYYSQPQQPTVQVYRTTAYVCISDNYYKIPIKVQVSGNSIRIIEQYVSNVLGGNWQRVSGYADKCRPMIAGNNPLESQFMYKASVYGNYYYYFDL